MHWAWLIWAHLIDFSLNQQKALTLDWSLFIPLQHEPVPSQPIYLTLTLSPSPVTLRQPKLEQWRTEAPTQPLNEGCLPVSQPKNSHWKMISYQQIANEFPLQNLSRQWQFLRQSEKKCRLEKATSLSNSIRHSEYWLFDLHQGWHKITTSQLVLGQYPSSISSMNWIISSATLVKALALLDYLPWDSKLHNWPHCSSASDRTTCMPDSIQ